MPGPPLLIIGLVLLSALAGGLLGWYLHAERHRRQRLTIAATWQEKLEAEELGKERLRRQIRSLAERLDAAREADREARRRLAATERQLRGAAATAEEDSAALARCRAALAETNRRRDELHAQLQRLLARSRELMAGSRAKDEKIFRLSRELDSWQERLPPLVYRFREKAREATAAHRALDLERARARELEDTLRTRILPLTDPPATDDGGSARRTPLRRDDLKRIRGIGPVLERLLNDLGIHRLQQIAEFGPDDVERVQAALKDFPDRVERDHWVEQARRLISEYRPDAGETSWTGRTET
jgi:predicted flap endonuclease-1-like 5' DNA nuclease